MSDFLSTSCLLNIEFDAVIAYSPYLIRQFGFNL